MATIKKRKIGWGAIVVGALLAMREIPNPRWWEVIICACMLGVGLVMLGWDYATSSSLSVNNYVRPPLLIICSLVISAGWAWFCWPKPAFQPPQLTGPPPLAGSPKDSSKDDAETRIEGKLDEIIRKQLESKSPPASKDAFSIRPELEFSSFGLPGRFTGFFVGYKSSMAQYVLIPATQLVYIRITNLQPVRTIIQRLQVSLDGCDSKDKLDVMMGEEVFSTNAGLFERATIGTPVVVRGGAMGRSMTLIPIKSADLGRSFQLNLPLLEQALSDHYLKPHESIGGWIAFSSSCPGDTEKFVIEDVAGRTFTYNATVGSNEMKPEDLSRTRTITAVRRIDLSGASIKEVQ